MSFKNNHFLIRGVISLILLFLSLAVITSLYSYNPSDNSLDVSTNNITQNLLGIFGAYIADILYQLFGLAAFILPILLAITSYRILFCNTIKVSTLRLISIIILMIFLSFILGRYSHIFTKYFNIKSLPSGNEGAIGLLLSSHLKYSYNIYYLISEIIIINLLPIFILNINFSNYLYKCYTLIIIIPKILLKSLLIIFHNQFINNILKLSNVYNIEQSLINFNGAKITSNNISEKRRDHSRKKQNISCDTNSQSLPSPEMLDEIAERDNKLQTTDAINKTSEDLLLVLKDFGIQGKIIDIKQGPVVTSYEFEPKPGTKSSRIIGLSDDIARSLSVASTRIAIIPNKNALGIELPNPYRSFFSTKKLINSKEFQNPYMILPIILGKDLGGNTFIVDLAKMPHLLIAGTTGSGKSVALNVMIISLLYKYTKEQCKMIMIDPKMLELSVYDNIPHLITPVVTESHKAITALKWATKEMENRYKIMSYLGVRSISSFNEKISEAITNNQVLTRSVQTGFDLDTGNPIYENIEIEMKKIPFIVIIVDEMADLMLVAGKEVEASIQRLAQMARAAGIHIIMATQRPSVDIITGIIKSNFPSRISFKVTSKIDSRTILGEQGAEQLLGMGDMLYMGSSSKIIRVHCPFVSDKEILNITDFLRTTGKPEYISNITLSQEDSDKHDTNSNHDNTDDNLYQKAVSIVKNERKSSISYIQRSLRIGYNRAANLVEQMEKNNILSAPGGYGKREILIPKD
ncbi:DNA translocase FtsK [Rickettsia endosymbiont of Cardiosporidium cionae]|uniref:DNA translocase FtsK n=1 Tax=Rickettsia endosymbiont of Cardiosporidium cionae TaxID=2777155 RepID=UPI00189483B4|nr:DNA translocase FtsK [Rickettsia endosymbiont of Cardiosporidium cionae]KAF8818299.1 DNA translocase FtsK [Rickettsia endosymbiont of Cardiosporidium cionae]